MSSPGRIRSRLARVERSIVGAFMRLIAVFAERRVRRGLEGKPQKRARKGLHVDVRDIKR